MHAALVPVTSCLFSSRQHLCWRLGLVFVRRPCSSSCTLLVAPRAWGMWAFMVAPMHAAPVSVTSCLFSFCQHFCWHSWLAPRSAVLVLCLLQQPLGRLAGVRAALPYWPSCGFWGGAVCGHMCRVFVRLLQPGFLCCAMLCLLLLSIRSHTAWLHPCGSSCTAFVASCAWGMWAFPVCWLPCMLLS